MKNNIKVLKSLLIGILFVSLFINVSRAATAPNTPILIPGLTPIKYVHGEWVDVVNTDASPWYKDTGWYNYENGDWANAKLSDGTVYVWIPRFTYKVENEMISIRWSDGKVDDTSDGYLRHPAFYFGEYIGGDPNSNENFIERNGKRNELTGFWIEKDLRKMYIDTIENALEDAINMPSNVSFGLPQAGAYTHITKASEWGALAYLAASKGNGGNDGRTTSNSTGVRLGSVSEYVMGIKGTPDNATNILNSNYKKYIDLLDSGDKKYFGYYLSEKGIKNYGGSINDDKILIRGGSGSLGFFKYESGEGGNSDGKGYRTVISVISEELPDTISFFDTEASVTEEDFLLIGVDFSVKEEWKFPETCENLFKDSDKAEGKKVIDLELIYEDIGISKKDLNAKVVKLICHNVTDEDTPEEIDSKANAYAAGKYTLIVSVGGKVGNTPVFMSAAEYDTKIVVNEVNLKNASDKLIKIGNIPNNKIRLNILPKDGNPNAITKVILVDAPDKNEYALNEKFTNSKLADGKIQPFLGDTPGAERSITLDNMVAGYETLTSTPTAPGETKLVNLVYKLPSGKAIPVTQNTEEFRITVSDTPLLVITGETKVGNNVLASQLLDGPDEYERKTEAYEDDLIAYEYIDGYMFSSWSSESAQVKAKENEYSTKIIIPSKSENVKKNGVETNEVKITANYVTPESLKVDNPQQEFIVNDDFTLGPNGSLVAVYKKIDGSKVERTLTLTTAGVSVKLTDKSGKACGLEDLQLGEYKVEISYVDKKAEYTIFVVNPKYNLEVYITPEKCGEVLGKVEDPDGNKKSEILSQGVEEGNYKIKYKVSFGNEVSLSAHSISNPSAEQARYVFVNWDIYGMDNLIPLEELSNPEISFTMPEHDITIYANFVKGWEVIFEIADGQDNYGSLSGELKQAVLNGRYTSLVKAEANNGYAFINWTYEVGSDENPVTKTYSQEEIIYGPVEEDKVITANFDYVWTVTFYNGDEVFKTIKVVNGQNGSISETPTKHGYVFTGWDKDLSCITSDVTTYAEYVPRINIIENASHILERDDYEDGMIAANIIGTEIKDGTLQYMIAESPHNPDGIFFKFKLDDVYTGIDGDWYHLLGAYRNDAISAKEDSSTVLTISSKNETEVVKFDYILSSSENSHLGITLNGERVVSPSDYVGSDWMHFEGEIPVVNGKIVVGLSYSQGENYTKNDFAAIRNLAITRKWTVISNNYDLLIPTEFGENYIHVKGTGSDDLTTIYKAVSDAYNREFASSYTIAYDANGGTGAPASQTKAHGASIQLSTQKPTRPEHVFLGWSLNKNAEYFEYDPGSTYYTDSDATFYAVWRAAIPMFAEGETWYTTSGNSVEKTSISTIDIVDSYEEPASYVTKWTASPGSAGKVTVWIENDGTGKGTYKLTIAGDGTGTIKLNTNSSGMFNGFSNITSISGLSFLDTSSVTSMSHMFEGCSSLTSIDLSGFDTSNVVYMNDMFDGCSSLTSIDISTFDTSNVTYFAYMFQDCTGLTEIKMSGINTNSARYMHNMFNKCSNLVSLNLSSFNTSKVVNMSEMFDGCSKLSQLDVSNFNTGKVTNMNSMFRNCSGLTTLNVGNFNTSSVTTMRSMFQGCTGLGELDVSNLNTANVVNMSYMFTYCSGLTKLDLSGSFNTGKVQEMYGMFYDCDGLKTINVSNFDTSNVIIMTSMFGECSSLEILDLSNFNTSKVQDMAHMFRNCPLKSINLGSFNTNSITASGIKEENGKQVCYGLAQMFKGCTALSEITLGVNFGQNHNVPEPGQSTSVFYVDDYLQTTIKGTASEFMSNYDWKADHRAK